jgi:ribose/xylose/arabinose/galactoside ABC-type transport system permease subunit
LDEVAHERRETGAGWTAGVILAVVVAGAVFYSRTPIFLDVRNLRNMAVASISFGLIAVGQTLLLRMRYLDPSAASIAGLAGVVAVVVVSDHHLPLVVGVVVAVLVGGCAGVVNGFAAGAAGGARFPALLATVGMLSIAELMRSLIIGDRVIPVHDPVLVRWAGTPGIIALIGIVLLFGVVISRSDVRASLARASRSNDSTDGSGSRKTKMLGFVVVGVLAATAGLADAARAQSVGAWPTTNLGLASVAAALAGGASILGGRGGAVTVVCGIVLVEAVVNGMQLWGAEAVKVTLAIAVVGGSALLLNLLVDRTAPALKSGE